MITMLSAKLLELDYKFFNALNGLADKSGVWDVIFIVLSEYVIFFLIAGLSLFILIKKRIAYAAIALHV